MKCATIFIQSTYPTLAARSPLHQFWYAGSRWTVPHLSLRDIGAARCLATTRLIGLFLTFFIRQAPEKL